MGSFSSVFVQLNCEITSESTAVQSSWLVTGNIHLSSSVILDIIDLIRMVKHGEYYGSLSVSPRCKQAEVEQKAAQNPKGTVMLYRWFFHWCFCFKPLLKTKAYLNFISAHVSSVCQFHATLQISQRVIVFVFIHSVDVVTMCCWVEALWWPGQACVPSSRWQLSISLITDPGDSTVEHRDSPCLCSSRCVDHTDIPVQTVCLCVQRNSVVVSVFMSNVSVSFLWPHELRKSPREFLQICLQELIKSWWSKSLWPFVNKCLWAN